MVSKSARRFGKWPKIFGTGLQTISQLGSPFFAAHVLKFTFEGEKIGNMDCGVDSLGSKLDLHFRSLRCRNLRERGNIATMKKVM